MFTYLRRDEIDMSANSAYFSLKRSLCLSVMDVLTVLQSFLNLNIYRPDIERLGTMLHFYLFLVLPHRLR